MKKGKDGFGVWFGPCGRYGFASQQGSPLQLAAQSRLLAIIDQIVASPARSRGNPAAERGNKAFAYWGEGVAVTVPITCAQARPALLPAGAVGDVDLLIPLASG